MNESVFTRIKADARNDFKGALVQVTPSEYTEYHLDVDVVVDYQISGFDFEKLNLYANGFRLKRFLPNVTNGVGYTFTFRIDKAELARNYES